MSRETEELYELHNDIYNCSSDASWDDSLDLAEMLYIEGWRKTEWISVKERLPEKEGYYITFALCSDNGVIPMKFVFTTVRGQKVKRWEWNGRISPWVVTHWMPLPEPPAKGV